MYMNTILIILFLITGGICTEVTNYTLHSVDLGRCYRNQLSHSTFPSRLRAFKVNIFQFYFSFLGKQKLAIIIQDHYEETLQFKLHIFFGIFNTLYINDFWIN